MFSRRHHANDPYLWIKSMAGLSVAAVATFNVLADKVFSASPSTSVDVSIALLGAVFGAVLASKA